LFSKKKVQGRISEASEVIEMALRKPRFDRTEEQPRFAEKGKQRYPEMVRYFRQRYNPRKESPYDFVRKAKNKHTEFLRKRSWSEKDINLAWEEILASLSRKSARCNNTVRELRRQRFGR
jgi:meiotically up-regulated gene 157 (Mug157) protein